MPDIDYEHIGELAVRNAHPPSGVDPEIWQLGYSNCISDLVSLIWPGKAGGERITLEGLRQRNG